MGRDDLVKFWREREVVNGRPGRALVVIMTTIGCSWYRRSGGCTMCGYFNNYKGKAVTEEDILRQVDSIVNEYHGEDMIKIYTSGSFLDPSEVKPEIAVHLMDSLKKKSENMGKTPQIVVESRPEYISEEAIYPLKGILPLIVAQGLETASDSIRIHSIRKGFRTIDFLKALDVLEREEVGSKVYLLLKPPYVTEREAIIDALKSIEFLADKYVQVISVNPLNVQRGTIVEELYKAGKYRPPWLWSLLYVLKKGKEIAPDKRIVSEPSGGGRDRGVHNCGRCDKKILRKISEFSSSPENNPRLLNSTKCDCIKRWKLETAFGIM
ncbi:MAG: archaeosine biosynthesis radical SAM protein RaSEA [Thermoplasmata archaeon]|nr:archaeosine biosynthesis radical SAM protein RaSEA [Thermoplasmata archaeon]